MRGRAQDPDPPGGVLDDRQHVQAGAAQGDGLKEVTGKQVLNYRWGQKALGYPLGRIVVKAQGEKPSFKCQSAEPKAKYELLIIISGGSLLLYSLAICSAQRKIESTRCS